MAKRRNLKKEKQLRNRAYAEKYRKTKTPRRGPGRPKSFPSATEAGPASGAPQSTLGATAAPEVRADRPRIGAAAFGATAPATSAPAQGATANATPPA